MKRIASMKRWKTRSLVAVPLAFALTAVAMSGNAEPLMGNPLQLHVQATGVLDKKFAQQPEVWIVDSDNNLLDVSDPVTVTTTGTGHITGTTTVNAVHGIAQFTDVGLIDTGTQTLVFTAVTGDSVQHEVTELVTPTADPQDTFWFDARPTVLADIAHVYRSGCPLNASGLVTVSFPYFNNQGFVTSGQLVINNTLGNDLNQVFHVAFDDHFRFTKIAMADRSDVSLMKSDVTSAFSCRRVTGRPSKISDHSYGLAIDINPRRNPYHTHSRIYPTNHWSTKHRRTGQGVLKTSSPIVRTFISLGWCWGGNWRTKDYQHFETHTSGCRAKTATFAPISHTQQGSE